MFSFYDESLVQAYKIRAQIARSFADADIILHQADFWMFFVEQQKQHLRMYNIFSPPSEESLSIMFMAI